MSLCCPISSQKGSTGEKTILSENRSTFFFFPLTSYMFVLEFILDRYEYIENREGT